MNDNRSDAHLFVQQLLGAAHTVEAELERNVQEASELSLAQLDFLGKVDQAGGALSLGKVAEELCCVRSNVTQLADRLEAQGWIRREDDPDDRRCVRAVLTKEGRKRLRKGSAARAEVEDRIAGEAGGEELGRTLDHVLGRIGARSEEG